MKQLNFVYPVLFSMFYVSSFSQVRVDHQIQLTGSGTNAKITGIQNVSSNPDAVSVDYIQRDSLTFALATGSSNAYSVSLSPAVTGQYSVGMIVHFEANFANTAAATLNVNNLGAKTIKKNYNSDLAANDIKSGQLVSAMYDGTNFQMLSQLGNTAGTTCKSVSPQFSMLTNGLANVSMTSNTTAFAEMLYLPCGITVNEISFNVLSVSTSGAINVGVYSEDGQTNLISVTSSNITTSGTVTIPVSGVTLAAGNYYFVIVPIGTASINFAGTYCNNCPIVSGKPVFAGSQSTTADSLPSTINPSALSTSYYYEAAFTLDN